MKFRCEILPKSDRIWTDDSTAVTIGDWEIFADSIVEFAGLTQPNVLIEHELTGGSVGRVLSVASTPSGLDAVLDLDPALVPNGARWVSGRIAWNHRDLHGRLWPAALLEVSLTSIPRYLVGQPDMVALSQPLAPTITPTSELAALGETMTAEQIEVIRGLIAEMLATKPAETEVKVEEPAALAEEASVEIEVGGDGEEDMVEETVAPLADPAAVAADPGSLTMPPEDFVSSLAEAEARSCLTAMLGYAMKARQEATMSQVRKDLVARGIEASKAESFAKILRVDKTAYEAAMSAIKPKAATARNAATPATAPGKMDRLQASTEALRISKETGESYSAAFKRLV